MVTFPQGVVAVKMQWTGRLTGSLRGGFHLGVRCVFVHYLHTQLVQ